MSQKLSALAAEMQGQRIADLMTNGSRGSAYHISLPGLHLDYSKQMIDDLVFAQLYALAEARNVASRAIELILGTLRNESENRVVLHAAYRGNRSNPDRQIGAQILEQREKLKAISDAIRSGRWTGESGEPITDVVNIGIGGSDLGPKMVCNALREFAHKSIRCHFLSNVDGAEINHLLGGLDPETTLFVISSKSFTTPETMLNAKSAMGWLTDRLGIASPQSTRHCIAVTSNIERALRFGINSNHLLTVDEGIGGRYSSWSSFGLPICISIGFERFLAFLRGGAAMDEHFISAPLRENMPVILALLGIWYNNFLHAESQAIIPYCQRLQYFVDHLQQVDMESNGKSALRDGGTVETHTGPIIWGQAGTNGQHAFFQLLHQGTRLVPVDFIGIVTDPTSEPEHHKMLLANMIAQAQGLMTGQSNDDINHHYPGNNPSSTLLLDELSPRNLGQLLALYEHKVFVQGCIWNINSFDQWGVELGKKLAANLRSGKASLHDPSTADLLIRTGIKD